MTTHKTLYENMVAQAGRHAESSVPGATEICESFSQTTKQLQAELESDSVAREERKRKQMNVAARACQTVREAIGNFEQSLTGDEEVGASFPSGYGEDRFYVLNIRPLSDELIEIAGRNKDGRPLVQILHVGQLSIQICALPKIGAGSPLRMGFIGD